MAKIELRKANQPKGKRAKLTPEMVLEARERYFRGESIISITKDYCVGRTAMAPAVKGITWRKLPMPLDRQ